MVNSEIKVSEEFFFGIATAGFQIEGGYNGPGEPANNWCEWESLGKVEPSGVAVNFWEDYEEHLDRVVNAGANTFRLSIEWARCEIAPNVYDESAFDHYSMILDAIHARSLTPLVSIMHFTTPAWLGHNPWLEASMPNRYANWALKVVQKLGDKCKHWVTLNEPNIYSTMSYFTGMFPPGRQGKVKQSAVVLDHQMTGHVLAYAKIKEEQRDSCISFNNFCFSVYELDRALSDIILARSNGIKQTNLQSWLNERKQTYYSRISQPNKMETIYRKLLSKILNPVKAYPELIKAVYASDFERTIDVVQIDFYNPITSSHIRFPGHKTSGGRNWLPGRLLWDDPPDPELFVLYCHANHEPGLDLWVVENGLCNRVKNGRAWPRLDGWNRIEYMTKYLSALQKAIGEGVPITGYWHWTLADNYEWGSYEPRFGIYGVDRERGLKILPNDSMGYDSAKAYNSLIKKMREGEIIK